MTLVKTMVLKNHGVILVLTNIKRVHPYTQVLWPMRECRYTPPIPPPTPIPPNSYLGK
jgi:hypothetical protein